MNFFKTVFSENPDPPPPESTSGSPKKSSNDQEREDPDPIPDSHHSGSSVGGGGVWSFGGLIQTLATKSESVIETYRRDLQEFSSGLKKEIEVAHGSLGTVGHAIDELGNTVLKGTAQIIAQGKDAILSDDLESDSSDSNNTQNYNSQASLNSKRYSRFDAQVRTLQGDASTYCDEPEDLDDYSNWKLGFVLEEKSEEIEELIEENRAVENIYKRVVPDSIDHQTFWCRYFFKKNGELGSEDGGVVVAKEVQNDSSNASLKEESSIDTNKNVEKTYNVNEGKSSGEESKQGVHLEEDVVDSEVSNKKLDVSKADDKLASKGMTESGESSKDSDVTVVSTQPSMPEEEDLGWDEIEDLSTIEDKKITHLGSPNRAELRKRLNS
uniref:BSD domain-containing protein n=1 Tax=Cannabis sativa TaxID=3483 RepID=A0A803NR98_CANSA